MRDCLEAGRESQGFSSTDDVSLAFWRQNEPLTGTWGVLFRLTVLPLGSGYLSLPRAEIKSTYHHTQHFYPGCGIKLRSSGKHLTGNYGSSLPLSADQQFGYQAWISKDSEVLLGNDE